VNRPLPGELRRLSVTPLSRGPAVELIAVEDLTVLDIVSLEQVMRWCAEYGALYHEEDPRRFTLDVTAAYALGRGYGRCVFRR